MIEQITFKYTFIIMASRFLLRAVVRSPPARGLKNLTKAIDDPEVMQKAFTKLKTMGNSYKGYLKYTAGTGALGGLVLSTAHTLDVKDSRTLLRTEMVGYPILGIIGGAFVGATSPVWIIFAPIGFVLGYDNMAAIGKLIVAGTLLSDD